MSTTIWKMTALIACSDGAGNVTHVLREFYVESEKSKNILLNIRTQRDHRFTISSIKAETQPYNVILAEIGHTQSEWSVGRRFD